MIFTRREARRIFAGRKTQHRFHLSRNLPPVGATVQVTYRQADPALGYDRHGEPKTEPVNLCQLRVEGFRIANLLDADRAQAAAEGFDSRRALLADWGREDDPLYDRPVQTRLMEFVAVHQDTPRILGRVVIAGRCGDYVTSPFRGLRDEPEAVCADTQRDLTREANLRDLLREAMRREGRSRLPFGQQLDLLRAEAYRRHVDVRDEVRAIERWQDPVAQVRQLDRMRAKLERPLALAA